MNFEKRVNQLMNIVIAYLIIWPVFSALCLCFFSIDTALMVFFMGGIFLLCIVIAAIMATPKPDYKIKEFRYPKYSKPYRSV